MVLGLNPSAEHLNEHFRSVALSQILSSSNSKFPRCEETAIQRLQHPQLNMVQLSSVATLLLALLHVYIMVLEMFLWTKPRGRKAFGLTPQFAEQTKALGANQGLYNGILAVGMAWGLLHPVAEFATQIQTFFCLAVVVAGFYGGATASRKIWLVQMTPAIIASTLLWLGI